MQQKIQQFVFLSERILSEAGELRLRRSWGELHNISVQLAPYMKQLSQNFDPKYALLFLLSCDNESSQKNGCFSMLFRKILRNIPNRAMFNVLSAVSRVELNNYLLPFLYEKGDIGSVAAYTAACLGLKVKYDAFEFFLNSREWTQEDLVNLSFLALADEKDSLIMNLDEAYRTSQKDVYGEFLNVLNASNVSEPVVPDIQAPETEEKAAVKTVKPAKTQQTTAAPNSDNRVFKLSGVKPRSELQRQSDAFKGQTPTVPPKPEISPVKKQPSKIVSIISKTNNQIVKDKAPVQQVPVYAPSVSPASTPAVTESASSVEPTSNTASQNVSETVANNETTAAEPKGNKLNDLVGKGKNMFNSLVEKANGSSISFDTDDLKDGSFLKNLINKVTDMFSGTDSSGDGSNASSILRKPWVAIVLVVVVLTILICVMSSSADITNSDTVVKAPPKEGKIPDFWVDAVTNKQLTPQYIAADVDYRMGELYLARNVYSEATKFFADACRTEPKHYLAKMRWGYAEMMQGNYMVSRKLYKEVYAADPKIQNLNLYMARNYALENDSNSAIKHYKEEYKNHDELSSAMELANYLAYIGKQNDAMDMIATLQEKYPGKMLILNSIDKDKSSEQTAKSKTKKN